jgi:hypothetical protein
MMRIMTRAQKISIGVALAAVVASVAGSGVLNPEIRRALGLPQQLEDPADRRAQASATAPASSETRATTVDTEKAEADARPDERTTFSADAHVRLNRPSPNWDSSTSEVAAALCVMLCRRSRFIARLRSG